MLIICEELVCGLPVALAWMFVWSLSSSAWSAVILLASQVFACVIPNGGQGGSMTHIGGHGSTEETKTRGGDEERAKFKCLSCVGFNLTDCIGYAMGQIIKDCISKSQSVLLKSVKIASGMC